MYNRNKKEVSKLYKVLKQKSSLTLPPDPGSVTQAIKRFNLQIKILVAVLKPKYDILIFLAEWLELVQWQVNYGNRFGLLEVNCHRL